MIPASSQSTAVGLPGWPLDARPSPAIPAPAWQAPECADGWPPQRVPGTPRCCLCSGPALAALQAVPKVTRLDGPWPQPVGAPAAWRTRQRCSTASSSAGTHVEVQQQPFRLPCTVGKVTAQQRQQQPWPSLPHTTPADLPTTCLKAPQAQAVTLDIKQRQAKSRSHAPATPTDCHDVAAGTPFPPAVPVCKGCCRCWAGDWLKPCSSRGGTAGSWWSSSFTPNGPPAVCCWGWPASQHVTQRGVMSRAPKAESGPAISSSRADAGLHCIRLHFLRG